MPGGVGRELGATLTVGRSGGFAHAGLGHDDHSMTGKVRPPGEVHCVAEPPERRVETAEGGKHLTPDEHPRGVDAQDVAAVVMLALVRLAGRRATRATPRAGELLSHLKQT